MSEISDASKYLTLEAFTAASNVSAVWFSLGGNDLIACMMI